jgi:hypothetical protein
MMFPGEDPDTYEGLREALLHDLVPRSPYERLLAENLITLEWEAIRHRRLRDDLIRAKARDLAIGAFETGKAQVLTRASGEATALGFALVGSDPERAAEATLTLVDKHDLTPGEIMAKAYSQVSLQVEVHEKKLAELEKRRQRLKEEYDRLRAVRPQPIEDAEIVG